MRCIDALETPGNGQDGSVHLSKKHFPASAPVQEEVDAES